MFSSWDTCAAGNCTEAEVAFSIIKWEWEREETTNNKFSTLLLSLLSLSMSISWKRGVCGNFRLRWSLSGPVACSYCVVEVVAKPKLPRRALLLFLESKL